MCVCGDFSFTWDKIIFNLSFLLLHFDFYLIKYISLAWGYAAHLLHCIAIKLRIRLSRYTIVPLGSFSKVIAQDGSEYELYGSNDISFGRLLRDRRFDSAMMGFIECLQV